MDVLTRNWLALVLLTAVTVALGASGGPLVAAGLLLVAWGKARMILGGFLHLRGASGWLGLAMVPLGIWLLGLWGLIYMLVS